MVRRLLIVRSPVAPPRSIVILGEQPLIIGRDESADVLLSDTEISRQHVRIERDPQTGDYQASDLGSRNGMYVDGLRATRASLWHGSVLRIGASLLLYLEDTLVPDAPLHPEWPDLLGHSVAMQRVRGEVELVAPRDLNVLIIGDTGVGKEAIAAHLHQSSGRSGAYLAVNCAAIPEQLAESELFGHAAGSYTGATSRSDGLCVAAHQGTLFLDEIGELPPAVQAKLLRALATGEVRPIGDTRTRVVDVRIIAATHRPLRKQVDGDGFRADLFARLAGWTIRVPPLRSRRDDIVPLAQHFAPGRASLSLNAAEALLLHDWPFNVRELRHMIEAAAVRAGRDAEIRLEHLPEAVAARVRRGARVAQAAVPPELLIERSTAPGRGDLLLLLEHFSGNVQRVADFYGGDRKQIYRWLKRHGIPLESFRED